MLIVDDHPIICNSYKDAFEEVSSGNENLHIQADVALDCDSAREKINNRWGGQPALFFRPATLS